MSESEFDMRKALQSFGRRYWVDDNGDAILAAWEAQREELADLAVIIERVMTAHWDIDACTCAFCCAGRDSGLRPRDTYLHDPLTRTFLNERGRKEVFGVE